MATLGSGRPGWIRSRSDHSCQGLTMGRAAGGWRGAGGGRPLPPGFGRRARTAAPASALISVGFWLTGVLSQSPHFRSYSNLVTSLTPRKGGPQPCSDVWAPGFIPLSFSVLCAPGHLGKNTSPVSLLQGPRGQAPQLAGVGCGLRGGLGPGSTPSPQGRDALLHRGSRSLYASSYLSPCALSCALLRVTLSSPLQPRLSRL